MNRQRYARHRAFRSRAASQCLSRRVFFHFIAAASDGKVPERGFGPRTRDSTRHDWTLFACGSHTCARARACVYVTCQLLSREVSPLITSLPATPRAMPRGDRAYHSFLRCNLQRPLNASMNEVGKLLEYRSAGCVYTRWIRKREPPSPPLLPTSESRAAVVRNQFQIAAGDNVPRPRSFSAPLQI